MINGLKLGEVPKGLDLTVMGYDWLALGNSITWHPVCEYWWGEWGMAASSEGRDYFHLVRDGLAARRGEVNAATYNFAAWELQPHDRSESLALLDGWLVPGVDLVTVQLGENASDTSTYADDLAGLVAYVRGRCPDARVVVVDDFWDDGRSAMRREAAEASGAEFVDLSAVRGDPAYQAGMGAEVLGAGGETHPVAHAGVASHPGDEGMAYIAGELLRTVDGGEAALP